jgi:uroporphyrinogen-III decarboxylase
MHSDGCIRELVDDILECGVDVLNLQDTVNGIDWIRSRLAGKICLEIDIDRQDITRFGTPAQIDDLIRQEVKALGSKRGGLMFIYGLYPGIPIENIRATMDAMQKYCAL